MTFTDAMAVAGVLSLSSLGIVAKVLIDEDRLKEPVGIQIFTAVVIAEILVLFIVGFAISEHQVLHGEGQFDAIANVGILLAQLAGFTIVTWIVCNKVIPGCWCCCTGCCRCPSFPTACCWAGFS